MTWDEGKKHFGELPGRSAIIERERQRPHSIHDTTTESEVELLGFALSNCVVEVDAESAKYLRAVHRTSLELAVQNQFGVEIGGFWLMADQISQLRRLPEYYSPDEAQVVAKVVETYLSAQLESLYENY